MPPPLRRRGTGTPEERKSIEKGVASSQGRLEPEERKVGGHAPREERKWSTPPVHFTPEERKSARFS